MNEYVEVDGMSVEYLNDTITIIDDSNTLTNIEQEAANETDEQESTEVESANETDEQESTEADENIEPLEVIGETDSGDELLSDQNEDSDEQSESLMNYSLKFNKGDKLRDQPAGKYEITMSKSVDYILIIDINGDRLYVNDDTDCVVFNNKLKTMTAVSRKKK